MAVDRNAAGVAGGVSLRSRRPRAPFGRLYAAATETEGEGEAEDGGEGEGEGEGEGGSEKSGGDLGDVDGGANRSGFLANPLLNPFVLYEVGRPVTSWLLVYVLYDLASRNVPQWGLRTWPELYDSLNHYQVPH